MTSIPRALRALSLALVGAACGILAVPAAAIADHHSASRDPAPLDFGQSDYVYNYDFRENFTQSRYKVDWTMTFIAYNSATINKFKSVMDRFNYKIGGGRKYATLNDGPDSSYYWIQDEDGGRKMSICPGNGEQTPHYRIYADGNDYLWQTGRGAYILGSTHRDVEECGTYPSFRDTEAVEGGIVTNLGTLYTVYHDRYSWGNAEPYRAQGTHIWDNNGYGSYVNMT